MSLSGNERQEIQKALLSAFPEKSSLEQMLSFELDKNLDAIALGTDLTEIVFQLIQTAEAQGWIQDLILAACNDRSGNPELQALAQKHGLALETTATFINWHKVCREMLKPQKRITSNVLMQDESAKKEREPIYVPLAFVQRTKTDKRKKEDISPDAGTRLYEPEYETQQRFEHEAFFSQILERGEGKTKGKRIAVIGEPGAGKTTLLQAIAFWLLEKDLGFPIWISLADLQSKSLEEYLLQNWLKNTLKVGCIIPKQEEILIELFQKNHVWLLLDGVDEISGSSASYYLLEEISRQLNGWVSLSRVVLTCRLNVWQADRHALETFETYRLLNFNYPQQVHQFIDNWFIEDIEKGERLKTELDSSGRVGLRDLVQTPLRLTLLCSIWQSEEGNLPQTKAGLYKRFVRQFYKWKENRFPTSQKEQRDLSNALGCLALWDIDEGGSRFRLLESFITKELGDPDDETSLFYKALQLGWLNSVGIAAGSNSEEKVYAFYHATFEEYFAALAVEDWHYFLSHVPQNPEQGTYRIFESQWKEVILLWLGREDIKEEQKHEFIGALVNFQDRCGQWNRKDVDKGFYEYKAYFLAAVGITELKDCSQVDEIVNQIVTWRFGYFNNHSRQWQTFNQNIVENARTVLVETNLERASAALENLIANSQDEYTRMQAAYSLGEIAPNNTTAITALVELIWDSQSRTTRWEAASSLVQIAQNNTTAITVLEEFIRNSQSGTTRWEAASSLVQIAPNNTMAITVLEEFIRDCQDEYTRLEAASSLVEIAQNNTTAITALEELIRDCQDEYTRIQAADSLGKIAPNNTTAITALEEFIRDCQDEYTRMQAADSLGEIAPNNTTAITALEELIRNSQDEYTRIQAADSLVKIAPNNTTAITALVELIRDCQDEYTRMQAANSLVKIAPNNTTAITALEELIRDSQSGSTRLQAADSLVKIAPNNTTAITALVELIRDSQSGATRLQAAYSLGEIAPNNTTAITVLEELIRDSQSGATRLQVAVSLGKIAPNNTTAITALEESIRNSQSESTRLQAAYSLVKIAPNNTTAITALEELIRDSQDEETRWHAAYSLVQIAPNNTMAITALVEFIRDSQSGTTRWLAAYSLVQIAPNNTTAITALVELIRDSQDEETRWHAASSLKGLLTEPQKMATVVTVLKNRLLNNEAYEVLWHCAQTMTYPDFYQAWNEERQG